MALFGKISARERYALRLILQLAKNYKTGAPISLAEISQKEKISLKYLEQLASSFKKSGWLKSIRGREGGYILTKNPDKISLKNFFEILKGNTWIIGCLNPSSPPPCALNADLCPSRKAWERVQKALDDCISNIKLVELIQKS